MTTEQRKKALKAFLKIEYHPVSCDGYVSEGYDNEQSSLFLTKFKETIRAALSEPVKGDAVQPAIDALPEKPMTEEEIMTVLIQTVINEGGKPSTDVIMAWGRMLKFLKAANILYVQE